MKIVLDTNVLIACISRKSQYNIIFQKILNGEIVLYISNQIIEEYAEILEQRNSPSVSLNVIKTLLKLENVIRFDPHFSWQLIKNDPDDDKFVDCVVAASATYLVTNDKHFKILKDIPFPPINVISAEDFLSLL
jgi:putative PIN family toxin of toxin-antitoxin system